METAVQNYEFYASKKILAPMVRAGRTPLRMLALEYGADLVYTEEIVDQKLLNSRRIRNEALNTVDFIFADEVVLRIAPHEKSRCVLQLGSSSAENAAQICTKFGPEVAAIDLNMGCPKPFSVHAGMGAALLSNQLKVKEILTAMVDASPVPVSAKIRVLDSHDQTMEFVRMVERCGISALAVHGRRRNERPQHKCRTDEIHVICDALTCPVIANGGSQDVRCHEDIERFRELCGASSVMVARKAFTNPSIFRPEGMLSMDEEIRNFLAKACLFDENFTAVKYALQRILGSQQEFDPRGRATVAAGTVREICRIWGMEANFLDCRRKRGLQHPFVSDDQEDDGKATKRPRSAEEDEQIIAGNEQKEDESSSNGPVAFRLVDGVLTAALSFAPKKLKSGVNGKATPKCEVLQYCRERRLPLPAYQATKRVEDCRFVAVCQVDGKSFSSPVSQPNIKMAEQVAALVALHGLNIRHRLTGDWEEEEESR